jgi:hypothetical protein
MATNHAVYTGDYLLNTQSVLYAGRRLRDLVDADQATKEYAITGLERAAQRYTTGGTSYRAFMFSELETTLEADKAMRQRTTEDAMVSVLTDLQVANVLMAAGLTLGETGEKAVPHLFDEALLRLENTTRAIEQPLSSPLSEGIEPGRFRFAAAGAPLEIKKSDDLPAAVETFRSRSEETLTALVNESVAVATSVITALSKLDEKLVLVALSKLGGQMQELPKAGRLFRQGVEQLERAIDALIHLLGGEALARIKDQVAKIWQDVKEGKYMDQAVEWAFDVKGTRTYVAEVLGSAGIELKRLDDASHDLARLAITFEEKAKMAQGLVAAVAVAGALLALTPLAGPELALFTASAYVVILAAVVLIGMDHADSGRILQRVRGVREITLGLLN